MLTFHFSVHDNVIFNPLALHDFPFEIHGCGGFVAELTKHLFSCCASLNSNFDCIVYCTNTLGHGMSISTCLHVSIFTCSDAVYYSTRWLKSRLCLLTLLE